MIIDNFLARKLLFEFVGLCMFCLRVKTPVAFYF